jgi:hypothetical protein
MVATLATSLSHFQVNEQFKIMVCILALFGLATVLATFHKISFFQNLKCMLVLTKFMTD